MIDIKQLLLNKNTPTYDSYYNGKMSYTLYGKGWEAYVSKNFHNVYNQRTSENIYKTVIDLYAENIMPSVPELAGFSDVVVPLLSRGECPVLVDSSQRAFFPEQYEMISDGQYTTAAIFTRSLQTGLDYVTFAYSDGRTELWAKDIPNDMSVAERRGYKFVEETQGNTLIRFALNDRGFGASLAALQDRINHSILDQTIIAEMYARPFWYLLNADIPVANPYLGNTPAAQTINELKNSGGTTGRVVATSASGPFGQLTPPTIADMVAYHDSIVDKVSQTTGIPQHYFKPGQSTPPTGVALKVLNKRFTAKIAQMRNFIETPMMQLVDALGVSVDKSQLWTVDNDLLQESTDAHGLALVQMGYPLEYVAQVVTPEVDLDKYQSDGLNDPYVDASAQLAQM